MANFPSPRRRAEVLSHAGGRSSSRRKKSNGGRKQSGRRQSQSEKRKSSSGKRVAKSEEVGEEGSEMVHLRTFFSDLVSPLEALPEKRRLVQEKLRYVDLLKVSRPGLWFVAIYMYMAPTGGNLSVFRTVAFWVGLVYVCFPVNLLVYGMNDYSDVVVDRDSGRKGNWLFGAKLSVRKLRLLPRTLLLFHGIPVLLAWLVLSSDRSAAGLFSWRSFQEVRYYVELILLYATGTRLHQGASSTSFVASDSLDKVPSAGQEEEWSTEDRGAGNLLENRSRTELGFGLTVFYLGGLVANVLYNFEPFRWSGKPPLEPLCSIGGYLLMAQWSSLVNGLPYASLSFHLYGAAMVLRSQYWFEYFDYDEDLAKNRCTTVHLFLLRELREVQKEISSQSQIYQGDIFKKNTAAEVAKHLDPARTALAKRRGGYCVLLALVVEFLAGWLLFPGHWILPAFSAFGIVLFSWTSGCFGGGKTPSRPGKLNVESALLFVQSLGGVYLVLYQWTAGIFSAGYALS